MIQNIYLLYNYTHVLCLDCTQFYDISQYATI